MSQCARVALWVPTEAPVEIGDGVVVKTFPDSIKTIATKFLLGSTGGPGGGITEAPEDGAPYVRQDADWVPLELPPVIDGGTF